MNMFIQYTGSVCTNTQLHGTIIDGEHIIYDKYKKYININLDLFNDNIIFNLNKKKNNPY